MKPIRWKYLFFFCICFISSSVLAVDPTIWQSLTLGLEYSRLTNFANFPAGAVHAFRVDLKQYHLKTAPLPNTQTLSAENFKQLMDTEHALVAINGGFFTPELKPLGLRVMSDQILNSFKRVSWWGVFLIRGNSGYVIEAAEYTHATPIDFAIQAGPILVKNDQVLPKANEKIDARTAIGISKGGGIILVATEDVLFSIAELAELLHKPEQQGGLGCIDAINLDGGHSTQLYTALPNFPLQVPSAASVADAVLVVR